MARMTKRDREERARHVAMLRDMLPPGSTVYTRIEHVSRSGMSRDVRVYIVDAGDIRNVTGLVASALDMPRRDRHGDWVLRIGGCGFDAGFHVVYELASMLYPDGFGCVGKPANGADGRCLWCPSNDHANGDRDYTPHDMASGDHMGRTSADQARPYHWHTSGGYALRHGRL